MRNPLQLTFMRHYLQLICVSCARSAQLAQAGDIGIANVNFFFQRADGVRDVSRDEIYSSVQRKITSRGFLINSLRTEIKIVEVFWLTCINRQLFFVNNLMHPIGAARLVQWLATGAANLQL